MEDGHWTAQAARQNPSGQPIRPRTLRKYVGHENLEALKLYAEALRASMAAHYTQTTQPKRLNS